MSEVERGLNHLTAKFVGKKDKKTTELKFN